MRGLVGLMSGLLLLSVACTCASAEVRASGNANNIVLQARSATMPEILDGLGSALHIKITLTGSTPRQITGDYSGPLRRVLSRLLYGDNYIVSSQADGLVITIVGSSLGRSITVAADDRIAGSHVEEPASPPGAQGYVAPEDAWKPAAAPRSAFSSIAAKPPSGPATATNQLQPSTIDGPANPPDAQGDAQGYVSSEDAWKPTAAPRSASSSIAAMPSPGPATATNQPPPSTVDEPVSPLRAQGYVSPEDAWKPLAAPRPPAAKSAVAGQDMSGFGPATLFGNEIQVGPAAPGSRSALPPSLAPMLTPPPELDK
jgi:hypothetical protein